MGNILSKYTKENCFEKYTEVRGELQTGDILLYRGNSIMSKSIQYFDDAYYNHTGIVWKVGDRYFTLDMWSNGLVLTPLSKRIKEYVDFCILRPKKIKKDKIEAAIQIGLDEWEGNTKYDFLLLPRVAIIKKTGIDLSGLGDKKKFICSEFVQQFTQNIGLDAYNNLKLITPQDFLRYIDFAKTQVLFDTSH